LLGLAGQRTRITWGLSFSEISQMSGPADTVGMALPAALPRRESQRPPAASKNRYLLPVALIAVATGVAVWMNWPKPEGQPVAINRPAEGAPTSEVMDLRGRATNVGSADTPSAVAERPSTPAPAEEPVEERTARGLVEPIGPAHGEPAAEDLLAPTTPKAEERLAPPAPAPSKSHPVAVSMLPRGRSLRSASNGRRGGPVRSPVLAAPEVGSPAPATDTGPDWKVSARQSSQSNRGPDRGTNNAPILD